MHRPVHDAVTLVAGSPCAGKSSYVDEHRQPGDLVLDYDRIAIAMGSPGYELPEHFKPFVQAARAGAIEALDRHEPPATVWLIACAPTWADRRWHIEPGRVVVLETPPNECHRRADAAGRPARWHDLIDDWWSRYEPE